MHTNNKSIILEVCAGSVGAALTAAEGGADRVELCDNLLEGGTTPSYATIALTKRYTAIPVFPIIRPRGGDFLYSKVEYEVMKQDIQLCRQLGCEGVVIGILTKDGKVDKERCKELVEMAWPMNVSFHRAFDMTADPFEALEDIISIGCSRILSSGRAQSAQEGAELIAELIKSANGRIIIMAGAGIRDNNLADLMIKTGVMEIHSSAKTFTDSAMEYHNSAINMGGHSLLPEYGIATVDKSMIANMKKIAAEVLQGNEKLEIES